MKVGSSHVLLGPLPDEHPALELAFAHALVRRASMGQIDEVLRLYSPSTPMVVFGRRDVRLPGFPQALELCRSAGFATAVRATGGRPVAYTRRALVVDHVRRDHQAVQHQEERFLTIGQALVKILGGLGVDARLGDVPGEYCPGAQSVNARGTVKLVGTAQRVIRSAWLFSSLIVVDDADQIRPLLTDVYGALDLPLDPASVGSVRAEAPQVDAFAVQREVLRAFSHEPRVQATNEDHASLSLARELLEQHLVQGS